MLTTYREPGSLKDRQVLPVFKRPNDSSQRKSLNFHLFTIHSHTKSCQVSSGEEAKENEHIVVARMGHWFKGEFFDLLYISLYTSLSFFSPKSVEMVDVEDKVLKVIISSQCR